MSNEDQQSDEGQGGRFGRIGETDPPQPSPLPDPSGFEDNPKPDAPDVQSAPSSTRKELDMLLRDLAEPLDQGPDTEPDPFEIPTTPSGFGDSLFEAPKDESAAGTRGESAPRPEAGRTETASPAVFNGLADFGREMFQRRGLTMPSRRAMFGGGLLALAGGLAGAVIAMPGDDGSPTSVVSEARAEGFREVWGPLRAAAVLPVAARQDPDVAAGWRSGRRAVEDAAYESAPDAETRLAALSAAVIAALADDDLDRVRELHQRLDLLPGAQTDSRAARLRASIYSRFADEAEGRAPRAAFDLRRRARYDAAMAAEPRWTVQGGASASLAALQMMKAVAAAAAPPPDMPDGRWQDGYNAAINRAEQAVEHPERSRSR